VTLPHTTDATFVTDGGMETDLVFHRGFELPCFASFPLLEDERGVEALRSYFEPYVRLARERGVGLVLDAPTWRANRDWGARLGYSEAALAEVNRRAVEFMHDVGADVVSGCVGPRGDAYRPDALMSAEEAERYHTAQVETLADAGVPIVSALTLAYADEAVGIVRAAQRAGIPVVISFTVETDGRLPSAQPLADAIEQVDRETDGGAAYFMVNCAHPTHFAGVLEGEWTQRLRGIRANASTKSHAELDDSGELDEGYPAELAARYRELHELLPHANVVGGCCGTDHRHVAAIADAWLATG
jgi:S-methylmethionine-dependent homocysteine/selenocysteine methylase